MKYLFSLMVFLGLMSCATSQTSKYSKIEYEVGPCFGFCPTYKITIDSDRNAILEAERFNFTKGGSKDDFSKPREGTFKAVISKEDYQKLNQFYENKIGEVLELQKGEKINFTDYIDLESLRISTPDNIIFEDNTENRNLEIAPMILIPFVENAFKHGNLKDFPLKISIGINGNQLLFHQKNKISKSRKDNSSGIGIENVKKRLSIIYSEKHTLEILNNEEFYEVNLKIDL